MRFRSSLIGVVMLSVAQPAPVHTAHEPVAECVPTDSPASGRTCENMLPVRWSESGELTSEAIGKLADSIRKLVPESADANVLRRGTVVCGWFTSSEQQHPRLEYRRPPAMGKFPTGGTSGRDLVVAVMDPSNDATCGDRRYDMHRKTKFAGGNKTLVESERVIQFITARTTGSRPSSADPNRDYTIGEWQAWAIVRKATAGGGSTYEIKRLDADGKYVQCRVLPSHKGYSGGFFGCNDVKKVERAFVEKRVPFYQTRSDFAAVLRDLADSTQEAITERARLDYDISTAPAWGDCGNLGCCAAE
jgi:hypothetical protein